MFRVYMWSVLFNGTKFNRVWIDPHYEQKHSDSINDRLILSLVLRLEDEQWLTPQRVAKGYAYYEVDLMLQKKSYRVILVVPPDSSYLGVRNVYRRK